ncbi:MAG: hypothetical protein OXL97_02770 [Chloroflexota bacterium]|nr:hypothetical protein [Chloroflexota bacterium]MDE2885729.1 hypothetical protein [Chloroflexota bacterium]
MNDLAAGAIGERSSSKPTPMVRLPHSVRNHRRRAISTARDLSPQHFQELTLQCLDAFDKTLLAN